MARVSDAGPKTLPVGEGGPLSLLVVADPPREIALDEGVLVRVGRAPNADVVIDDGSLSRLHAGFRLVGDHVEVQDLESSNGTIVRGAKLAAGEKRNLDAGDSALLGTVLVVAQRRARPRMDREPPAASAPSDELVARIAASTISVLVLGETGVGKEVMAERIHALSARKGPLVKLNCGALPANLLEAELFGYERGAFTGAVKDKPGLVESADRGTLFLDEIGEASLDVQVKLLRVLETRETQRVGALAPVRVDVRFVAATTRIPDDQIRAGTLRADLYYRLAGFAITIPPLRDRRGEIPALVAAMGGKLHPDALARLARHDWPGNVRELRNVLERARVLADGAVISRAAIDEALRLEPARPAPVDADRARVLAVLDECGGNQSAAAEKLGISRRTLVYRLQAWGLTRPRRTPR